MKKIISLLLIFIFMFLLCGCKSNVNIEKTIWASELPLQDQLAALVFDENGNLEIVSVQEQ